MLASMTKATSVLELGTFTGYGALSLAEGLGKDGTVLSCDKDERSLQLAEEFLALAPSLGSKVSYIQYVEAVIIF